MHGEAPESTYHGLLAEFASAQELVDAAEKVHGAGYRAIDAYTPFPIEALSEIVCDHHKSRVPLVCLAGGTVGAFTGWALASWTSVIDYPLNIGGKPFYSWPAFIPVIFECTILFAAFSTGLGMIALNRLPEPYHPVFNVEAFRLKASRDGFFLAIEASDPKFDRDDAVRILREAGAAEVHDVEA